MRTFIALCKRMIFLIFMVSAVSSCKKDSSTATTGAASRLSSNKSNLVPNGLAFASNTGIVTSTGTFPFSGINDLAFACDIMETGFVNQFFCYTPGAGTVRIFQNNGTLTSPNFACIYSSSNGITDAVTGANYNLNDSRDRILPYNLDGTGLRHIICYRPGTGAFWIFRYDLVKRGWVKVMSSSGIGPSGHNYNLTDNRDQIVPFDFSHSGYAKDLICYRPGAGTFWVFQNIGTPIAPSFYPSIQSSGVGTTHNFDLNGSSDQIVPWDVVHDGQKEGLLVYRPGAGVIGTYSHTSPTATTFANVAYSTTGIISANRTDKPYDLMSTTDRIIGYPPFGTGSTAALVIRPGGGAAYGYSVLDVSSNNLVADEGTYGIGSTPGFYFALNHSSDRVFAFDGSNTGSLNCLACYSPGYDVFDIFSGTYQKMY